MIRGASPVNCRTYRRWLSLWLLVAAVCCWARPSSAISSPFRLPTYHGGQIIQPRIIAVYWGPASSSWSSLQTTMNNYLVGLTSYTSGALNPQGKQPAIAQYGIIGSWLEASYVDTNVPTNFGTQWHTSRTGVATEIQRLQTNRLIPALGPMDLVMVFTDGITFDDSYGQWCDTRSALSQTSNFYTINPYPYIASCGSSGNSSWTATQIWEAQTSQMFQDAATNPAGTAWYDAGGNVIGDQCAWSLDTANTVLLSFGAVQTVVDHQTNSCSVWTPEMNVPVAAASQFLTTYDQLDVVALNSNRGLSRRRMLGNQWNPVAWTDVGQGPFESVPTLVPVGSNGMSNLFAKGTDGTVSHTTLTDGAFPPQWENLGGGSYGPVAAVANTIHALDIFIYGTDGNIWTDAWNGSNWQGWAPMPGGGVFNGPPVVARTASGRLYVFAEGTDGCYYYSYWNGSNFQGWTNSGFAGDVYIGPPAVVTVNEDVGVFGQGTDWRYYHHVSFSGHWTPGYSQFGGAYTTPPAAAVWAQSGNPTTSWVIGLGTDAPATYISSTEPGYSNGGPNGTWTLTDTTFQGYGTPALNVVQDSGIVYGFFHGHDDNLWIANTSMAAPASWANFSSMGLSIL